MTTDEIKETVFANNVQIDKDALLLAEAIFEEKPLDGVAKAAAYWITIGMMLSKSKLQCSDDVMKMHILICDKMKGLISVREAAEAAKNIRVILKEGKRQ